MLHPNIFFDSSNPPPELSVHAYETRRHELISLLDKWHATATLIDHPPFTLQSYIIVNRRTNEYSSTPKTTLVELGVAAEGIDTLSDAEKLRFIISPEVIAAADRTAGILIANTIGDEDYL